MRNDNNQQIHYFNDQKINNQNNITINFQLNDSLIEIIKKEKIFSFRASNQRIYKVAFFNSNKSVSVSTNNEIKIWDENFKLIQTIKKAHLEIINYVTIINENTFATCSADKSIHIYRNENNTNFKLIISKENAHKKNIGKIIYYSKEKILISSSLDYTVKIWKEINNDIQCITQLNHSHYVKSIFIIEDDNILISSGFDGTRFWNFGTYECIYYNDRVESGFTGDTITSLNNNKFIFGGGVDNKIQILSFNKNKDIKGKLLKEIQIDFECFCVQSIGKKYFLVGGWSTNILVFDSDNYYCDQIIFDAHSDNIKGFNFTSDKNYIISYSYDGYINIWDYNKSII